MIGILLVVVVIALVVFGIRTAVVRGGGAGPSDAHAVRRFFQYLLLYGLLVVSAMGLSGLLGELLQQDSRVVTDQGELALSVAFTVVGVPLFAGMAWWTRRAFAADPAEARSVGWAFYVTVASVTALIVAMISLYGVLAGATGLDRYDATMLAQAVVWGSVWGVHWWLDARVTPVEKSQAHHLLGSLIGLGTAAAGLAVLLSGAIDALFGLGEEAALVSGDEPMLRGAVLLAVGAPVWLLYWMRTASRSGRSPLWLAYVLLVGVAGGLVTAVVSSSIVVYDVLVWLIGEPATTQASLHFERVPDAAAAAVVGVLVWWYHHATLRTARTEARTEVVRVYEYLMAGTGLVAAAVGLTMVLASLVEAVTTSALMVGGGAVNTLIAGVTLLVVGGPVWALFWRRIQTAAHSTPQEEQASPTRRVYLLLLFGVAGIAAVVSLLVGVYILVQDMLEGVVSEATLRSMRVPIGILVSTGILCGYHWTVYRSDREKAVAQVHGPHYVLLVGPQDPDLARTVAHRTGGRVQAWPRTDAEGVPWSADGVLDVLDRTEAEEVIVVSEADGLHAIPVHRH